MKHKILKYLFDINTAIDSIDDYLGNNRKFSVYQNNKLLRRAVERELEIVGEAVNCILKIDESFKLENARKIVDTRNWVIHGYDKVDDIVIWGIIMDHLPILKKEVEGYLSSNE